MNTNCDPKLPRIGTGVYTKLKAVADWKLDWYVESFCVIASSLMHPLPRVLAPSSFAASAYSSCSRSLPCVVRHAPAPPFWASGLLPANFNTDNAIIV